MLKRKRILDEGIQFIEAEFGVSYSSWQVRRILKFGMKYTKIPERLQKAENAEETLKKLG